MILLLVNFLGLALIALIIWWFWLHKTPVMSENMKDLVVIEVANGVYQPAYIQAVANRPITLRFIREDATPCASVVIFNTLNISQELPLQKPVDISLTIKAAGEYEFTCQMGMYRGKLFVKI